ncbi:MAG: Heptaprenyl diphosphate synthase component 2 [bacterium ADurb.Bin363]|nr:MAG: Heptaprenyl diphosphate synthase component 2 [bacterium ADurb.Bin363]
MFVPRISLIKDELESVEKNLNKLMKKLEAQDYCLNFNGTFLNATLLLLSYRLFSNKRKKFIIHLATALDGIYIASSIHNRVIDNSMFQTTDNYKKENKISILIADHILSTTITFLLKEAKPPVAQPIYNTLLNMCEGGLLKIKSDYSIETTEKDYINMVEKGMASITEMSCKSGGIIGKATDKEILLLNNYGRAIGIAFSIGEDLLEIKSIKKNKEMENRSSEKLKVTLPLIYTLNKATQEDRFKLDKFYSSPDRPGLRDDIKKIIDKYEGLKYASKKVSTYVEYGKKQLTEIKTCEAKKALYDLGNLILTGEWWDNERSQRRII